MVENGAPTVTVRVPASAAVTVTMPESTAMPSRSVRSCSVVPTWMPRSRPVSWAVVLFRRTAARIVVVTPPVGAVVATLAPAGTTREM